MISGTTLARESDGLYRLVSDSLLNRYYVVSDEGTRRLMASPEVVGFESYRAMLSATTKALEAFKAKGTAPDSINILTILRGGLNYPIEESCHKAGILVPQINFMSCERIIRDGVITGLDVKYEKIHPYDGCTLMIGDIVASGQTLQLCFQHVIDLYRSAGCRIRRIIFFTVGGTKALPLMEGYTERIREFWPDFEGFDCVFYEGIFRVYEDKGVTGVNIPDIDFCWNGGAVAPEFREYVLDYGHAPALLEKCIIYDGGARRYEIRDHIEEVTEYWEALLKACDRATMEEFIAEKLGYGDLTFEQWTAANRYGSCECLRALFEKEKAYVRELRTRTIREVCKQRLAQLKNDFRQY